jgi:hypothetical protein
MLDNAQVRSFFQNYANAVVRGDVEAALSCFQLPLCVLQSSQVVTAIEPDMLKATLQAETKTIEASKIASLEANPVASGVRDGAFRVSVHYTLRSLCGKRRGVTTSKYFCELQPNKTFLISFASFGMLKPTLLY